MAEIFELRTTSELNAKTAEMLPAFGGLSLINIKRKLSEILALIGRDGIFDQYTLHDVSHIDSMLESLEWIIPAKTAEGMTAADWLVTVLAIYFHDVGMLVTKDEFEHRDESAFPQFCDQLFSGRLGVDYRSKVEMLGPGDSDRFLYQEFVRQNHADRSRDWVMGTVNTSLGVNRTAVEAVSSLLSPLDHLLRKDLGMASSKTPLLA